MGIVRRTGRWARQRPAAAALIGAAVVVVGIIGATSDSGTDRDVVAQPPITADPAAMSSLAAVTSTSTTSTTSTTTSPPVTAAQTSPPTAPATAAPTAPPPPTPTPIPTPQPAPAPTDPPAIQPLLAAAPAARQFSTSALGSASCTVSQTLQSGASGDSVRCLQRRLAEALTSGPSIGVDGDFGPQTDTAVREYQASAGLTVDGVAGRQTLTALGIWKAPSSSSSSGGGSSSGGSSSGGGGSSSGGRSSPYANCTEAKAAGHHDIPRGSPLYTSRQDGDGDGVACES